MRHRKTVVQVVSTMRDDATEWVCSSGSAISSNINKKHHWQDIDLPGNPTAVACYLGLPNQQNDGNGNWCSLCPPPPPPPAQSVSQSVSCAASFRLSVGTLPARVPLPQAGEITLATVARGYKHCPKGRGKERNRELVWLPVGSKHWALPFVALLRKERALAHRRRRRLVSDKCVCVWVWVPKLYCHIQNSWAGDTTNCQLAKLLLWQKATSHHILTTCERCPLKCSSNCHFTKNFFSPGQTSIYSLHFTSLFYSIIFLFTVLFFGEL